MTSLTIPAKIENWVIKPSKKIEKRPRRVYITYEYDENTENTSYKNIEASLNKVWKNENTTYDLKDIQNV